MKKHLHLFSGYGVELEYMIVDKDTLTINPIADKIIFDVAGEYVSDVERGRIAWSNEIVLHVIELKTNKARKNLNGLNEDFEKNVNEINNLLHKYNSMLMPTGAHPFMNPFTDTKLWPHENNPVYESYNRIFDCRGHGWANLQSTHINLPFADDFEFRKLHSAIRFLLPILPSITSSTPVLDGAKTGYADMRLEVYRTNQKKIPSIAGKIIPELIYSKDDYEKKILKKIYSDITPYDPEKILQYEWLNSRGAITRFDRNTIEIRIIDSQECPKAEIAITAFIVEVLKALIDEKWIKLNDLEEWHEDDLFEILMQTIKTGENAMITNSNYIASWGISENEIAGGEFWKIIFNQIYEDVPQEIKTMIEPVKYVIEHGTLSSRILNALDNDLSRKNIFKVYKKLAECLEQNEMFLD